MNNTGKFVISLDFELYWGVRDKRSIQEYGENIRGVHQVIPRLLNIFREYGIKATFSTVGFLFFDSKSELTEGLPDRKPAYTDPTLSPYNGHMDMVGDSPANDPYHFAPHLIKQIQEFPEQEIGSHTFSHYYCLERGQTVEDFEADLEAAINIAAKYGVKLTSLVFPRNQFNNEYLRVCREKGITCYRGNELSWLYEARSGVTESRFRRALRLIDAYINISGHNCYADNYMRQGDPANIPATRFLRPYSTRLKALDGLRLNRIKSGMTHAAKNALTYHLWWHPHNFGMNQDENFGFLKKILDHFTRLNKQYNFESYTMSELTKKIKNG